jgi:signal peptidase I
MWKFLLLFIFALIIVFSVFFRVFRVNGESMSPLLSDGSLVLVKRPGLSEIRPATGDIVVFPSPLNGELNIKKCTAVDDGEVFVTGINLPESTDSRHY